MIDIKEFSMTDMDGITHSFPAEKTLIIFIDETGNECLKDPDYPIFGIGGCIISGLAYLPNIALPWSDLKNKEFGGKKHLHATDLKNPSKAQLEILNNFFSAGLFGRFATTISDKTILNIKQERLYSIVVRALINRISDILKYADFDEIVMVFEESKSTQTINHNSFAGYELSKGNKKIPITFFYTGKDTMEPGLEVADFIIHTAGTTVRDYISGKIEKLLERQDFFNVFETADPKLSSFIMIEKMDVNYKK